MNLKKAYTHLMSGVSYFLPFVIAGGLFIAFAFLVDAQNAALPTFGSTTMVPKWLLDIGIIAMSLMLPMLAGYIGYSIGDRPAILLGMVSGIMVRDNGAGFLGAIAVGFASGYVILLLKKTCAKLPRSLEGTKTLLIYPIVGIIMIGLIAQGVIFIVKPINEAMTSFLQNLSGTNAVLLGALIGGMLAFDLGGPVNKAAYLFAAASLTAADGSIAPTIVMASAGASGMVVSTSCAVAATLFPKKFTKNLLDSRVAAYIMGFSFIAEGGIPFVIYKPKVVLPALVIGSAVTGGLVAFFGITLGAPVGGLATLPLVSNIPLYLLSFIIGVAVSVSIIYVFMRKEPDVE